MELADSKPLKPVRRGPLLGPAKGMPMVVKEICFQNQKIAQTASISV